MAIPTLGHAVTVGDTGTSSDTVQSVTTSADETYMLVCVGIVGVSMSSVQAVTFGATSLTQLADELYVSGTLRAVLYGGTVPGSTTANVTVDYLGGNANAVIAIRCYEDVVSAGTAVADHTAGAETATSVTLTGVDFARCVDFIVTQFGGNPTIGAGQATEFTRFQDGASQVEMDGSFEDEEATLSWSALTGGTNDAIQIGIPLVGAQPPAAVERIPTLVHLRGNLMGRIGAPSYG